MLIIMEEGKSCKVRKGFLGELAFKLRPEDEQELDVEEEGRERGFRVVGPACNLKA